MTKKKTPATPLLDELEKGPWPSFIKEIKKEADRPMVKDLLGLLERSYEEHIGHWKHGGLVGELAQAHALGHSPNLIRHGGQQAEQQE